MYEFKLNHICSIDKHSRTSESYATIDNDRRVGTLRIVHSLAFYKGVESLKFDLEGWTFVLCHRKNNIV